MFYEGCKYIFFSDSRLCYIESKSLGPPENCGS